MIIRYSLTGNSEEVGKRFSADVTPAYRPYFNAAPTHLLPLLTQESRKGFSFFYWGAPPKLANQKPLTEKIVNSWIEWFPDKPVLQKKLREKRCLIPADGFYGWKKIGKKASIPYRFTLPDKNHFSMAGLWEEYDDEKGEAFHTFALITTPATSWVSPIMERMPLILQPESERSWLEGPESEILPLLTPFDGKLEHYSVSPKLNAIDRNEPSIAQPAPPADQFGNLSLFD